MAPRPTLHSHLTYPHPPSALALTPPRDQSPSLPLTLHTLHPSHLFQRTQPPADVQEQDAWLNGAAVHDARGAPFAPSLSDDDEAVTAPAPPGAPRPCNRCNARCNRCSRCSTCNARCASRHLAPPPGRTRQANEDPLIVHTRKVIAFVRIWPKCLPTYLPTHPPTHVPTNLRTYVLTSLPTNLRTQDPPTHVPT